MKNVYFLLVLLFVTNNNFAQSNFPSDENQITAALQAAPEGKRDDATVLGYDKEGKLITLKKGSNEFICVTDNPLQNGFSAACYHKDLDEFMARGRGLRLEGKSEAEIFEIRGSEAKSGKLKMPDHPSTLYILYGKDAKFDVAPNKVINANYRWVIYIAWATPESTGLPTSPMVPGGPWIMLPGTHKAHIMVTPPIN